MINKYAVQTINVEHFAIYKNLSESLYDIIRDDLASEDYMGDGMSVGMLGNVFKEAELVGMFKDGYSPTLVGEHMEKIEYYNHINAPFMIVVWDQGSIFATIKGKDVNY